MKATTNYLNNVTAAARQLISAMFAAQPVVSQHDAEGQAPRMSVALCYIASRG